MAYVGFSGLKAKLAAKGVENPAALAATIGRNKYGKEKFQEASAEGDSLEGAKPKKQIRSLADLKKHVKGME